MRRVLSGLVVVVSLVLGSAAAQQEPNFSGAWTASKDVPPGLPVAPSPVFGPRFWVTQDSQSVVITRPLREVGFVATNALDGTQASTRVPGNTCLGDAIVNTTVTLKGGQLTHTIVSQISAGATAPTARGVTHTFRLVAPDTLVVESMMRTSAQAEPTKVATVYKKSADTPPPTATPPVKVATATLSQMTWLAGTWIGTTGTTTMEERWSPAVGGAMHAVSRTLNGASLTAFEFLCIAERAGGLVYTAMPNARTPATDFFLTAIDATSATFENPAHDFPKKIRYALREDGTLEAVVSGAEGQRSFTLRFKKQN